MTELAAWKRARDGDPRAFADVWDMHHRRVLRYLTRMGVLDSDAEDLTAAVFLELWRKRASVRMVDGSVLPWLLVTAQNVLRNAGRARRRYRRFLGALPPPQHVRDHAEDIADGDSAHFAKLRAEIAALRPADAALLAMTAVEGFSVREAAEAVGISEAAARTRLSRLRRDLRQKLSQVPIPGGE